MINLKEWMKDNRLSCAAVARAIGVHRSVIWNMVNGKARVSSECAKKLARAYGGTPWDWYEEQARRDVTEGGEDE